MIKCHLSRILGERRMHLKQLADQTGLSYYTLWMLYHERTKAVYFDVIGKICRALDIPVGELFEYRDADKKGKRIEIKANN